MKYTYTEALDVYGATEKVGKVTIQIVGNDRRVIEGHEQAVRTAVMEIATAVEEHYKEASLLTRLVD